MFDFWIAFILGFGVGGWLFFKLNHSGGEADSASHAVAGVVVGTILTFILFTLFRFVLQID